MRTALILLLVLHLLTHPALAAELPTQPNILFILTDDQGYGDLSCHGNPILKTPNIDALYARSVRFTDFHVSPTCAPTRTALMTGRHEFHSGVTHTINERERMSLQSTTIAQVLKTAGYTTGIFGKWHLGDEDPYQPSRRGFDEVYIHGGGGIGQTYPGSCGDAPGNTYINPTLKHNGTFEKTNGYCTDLFFKEATRWIGQVKGKQPFFCYIATNAPHAPLQCPPDYEARYTGKVPPNVAKFFGMIANIDDNVGRLMTQLNQWDLERNTLVIFMTDNGGTAGVKVFNAGMHGAKVTPYNGGTRVPCFMRLSDAFPQGADVPALSAHIDLFPTLAELANAKIPEEVAAKLEGHSLLPLLKNSASPWPERTLVTHVGRWPKGKAADAKFTQCSIRRGNYNMVRTSNDKPWELYNLNSDPGETHTLTISNPQLVADLSNAYDTWWTSILPDLVNEDATGPKINPFREQYEKQFGPVAK
ncbi:MAG: arylsulfatase family protein [Phycisphaerales bacterium]|nr:arylsulfatase family protein [Phycisphaerales bacterium]